jgi:hypothetical protein
MHYEQSEFYDLIDAIEDEGGKHLAGEDGVLLMCTSRTVKLAGKDSKELTMPGCGNTTIVEIPYQHPVEDATNATVLSMARFCAVCDDLGWWPRYIDRAMRRKTRLARDQ